MPKGRTSRAIESADWINREMPCGKNYSGKAVYISKVSQLHARVCDVCVHIKSHAINVVSEHGIDNGTLREMRGANIGQHAQPGVIQPRGKPIVALE